MQFSRIISLFIAVVTVGLFASAKPIEYEKRQLSSITGILGTLTSVTNGVLPQISLLGTSGNATNANVAPLVDELTQALNTAGAALNALNVPGLSPISADPDLVAVVEGLIAEITAALDTLVGSAVTELDFLLSTVDLSLNQVLGILSYLVTGILSAVSVVLDLLLRRWRHSHLSSHLEFSASSHSERPDKLNRNIFWQ